MKAFTTFASAAALAVSLAASAAPVHAAVFADFTPDTNVRNFRWINNGANNSGTGGHLLSMATASPVVAENVHTHFSFLDPALSALAFIPALLKFDATVVGHAASVNGVGVWTQTNLNGHFSIIYAGATVNNYHGSGINLLHNSNLLSGVFTDAWMQGAGGSGSLNLANLNGGHVSFTSHYETFAHLVPNTEEFAINLLSVNPNFGANPGKALKSFRANGGGNFDFLAAPEPATWGMMIAGFGGIGLVMRSRRRTAAATA